MSAETLHSHGGRRLTVPGVGLVEIGTDENGAPSAITLEPLSPEQQQRLDDWLEFEWPRRRN